MTKTVYIAEKPDVGRKIAAVIGVAEKVNGGIRCTDGTVVTWCFGHLLEPKMPEDIDPELKAWSWETLPIVPKPFQFKPRDDKAAKQLSTIGRFLQAANEVVLATDADREGELIGWEVLTWHKWKGRTRRLWLDDQTPPAIRKAISALKPGEETKPLYLAALARMCADFLVGINMSRAVTLRLREGRGKPLSIGRVQTPTLALIVRQERRIRDFKPETYYELTAQVTTASGAQVRMRHAPPSDARIKQRAEIDRLRQAAEGQSSPIQRTTEQKSEAPPGLLDLARLQQEANQRFGLSADRTLKIAQDLYEKHEVLSYPRTESTALPEAHQENIPTIRANLARMPDLGAALAQFGEAEIRTQVYNDAKVESHYAIIPTLKAPDPAALSEDETRIYLLVARHWIAAHMPDRAYLATRLEATFGGVPFAIRGTRTLDEGWRRAFQGEASADGDDGEDGTDPDAEADAGELPEITDGEQGTARPVEIDEKVTKAPTRFSEAELLRKMRNVASEIEDPAIRKLLRETSGLGTSATRAGIIETLKKRSFIVVRSRKLEPTEAGMALIDALEKSRPLYADPVQTARWEDGLADIAASKASTRDFIQHIVAQVTGDVTHFKEDQSLQTIPDTGAQKGGSGKSSGRGRNGGGARGSGGSDEAGLKRWKEAMDGGTPLNVPFDQRGQAKQMGAFWDKRNKLWKMHPEDDPTPFKNAGWL